MFISTEPFPPPCYIFLLVYHILGKHSIMNYVLGPHLVYNLSLQRRHWFFILFLHYFVSPLLSFFMYLSSSIHLIYLICPSIRLSVHPHRYSIFDLWLLNIFHFFTVYQRNKGNTVIICVQKFGLTRNISRREKKTTTTKSCHRYICSLPVASRHERVLWCSCRG